MAASSATVVAGVLVDAGELQDDASDDDIQRCIRVGEPLVRVLQRPPGSCERWCEQNVANPKEVVVLSGGMHPNPLWYSSGTLFDVYITPGHEW